ncbi:MAG TPA: ECF-type sigma factor [Planctomycetaceae bacterium]|nr:ECF-type sigma factor [Planctomycetaceae bacterium]
MDYTEQVPSYRLSQRDSPLATEVTRILSAIEQGDPQAAAQLLPLVYDELRKLAAAKLDQEQLGQTLQATALVHEAYLKLIGAENAQHWNSRGHFFGAAAESMRRILVDLARRKQRPKHGGERQRVNLDEVCHLTDERASELLSLHAALEKLEAESPEKAQLVKLRYFAGLSHQEAARAMGISRATADRHWAYARVFLRCELDDAENF